MAKFFSISVHSSVRMKKDLYYFIYKGTEFKYTISQDLRDADGFVGKFEQQISNDECYELMAEFLSAIAFAWDAKVIPEPGLSTNLNCDLADYLGGYIVSKKIPIEEIMDEFWYVPPLRTPEQITLARLYREARSSHNVYLSLLFYWHSLVYPSDNEQDAVDYVNRLSENLPNELMHLSDYIERITENPLFLPEGENNFSLGSYFQFGIRNSIAHIVRKWPNARNLQLDNLSELRHLSDVDYVLRIIVRYKLENDWKMNEPHDPEIFRSFEP